MSQGRILAFVLGMVLLGGCGGGANTESASGGSPAPAPAPPAPAPAPVCLGSFLGQNRLLIGGQMEDTTAQAAPFDLRYTYVTGGLSPRATCHNDCQVDASCGQWWGCWQDPSLPPGQRIRDFLAKTEQVTSWQGQSLRQRPWLSYYQWFYAAGYKEGAAEVQALNDAQRLRNYLDDWRFLLQQVGTTPVILHIEPDLWGFVRDQNADPHQLPAPVRQAAGMDCQDQEDSVAGLARCMLKMARIYAPQAALAIHASPWYYHMPGDAQALTQFMKELVGEQADIWVTDPSDRDAGYYLATGMDRTWNIWDESKARLYLDWSAQLYVASGKPMALWQLPLGNSLQNNTPNHWKDNRVEWLFAHTEDVVQAGIGALLFGAGQPDQTLPETDGGLFVQSTIHLWQKGGQPLCP
ncbi:MAG: hypothetical protein P3W87_005650 [Gammaproteobacteria bacterium]|nr:hypothetical protein [Gammaproteobacteria bacterium]